MASTNPRGGNEMGHFEEEKVYRRLKQSESGEMVEEGGWRVASQVSLQSFGHVMMLELHSMRNGKNLNVA